MNIDTSKIPTHVKTSILILRPDITYPKYRYEEFLKLDIIESFTTETLFTDIFSKKGEIFYTNIVLNEKGKLLKKQLELEQLLDN
jgi:hypothetical protein